MFLTEPTHKPIDFPDGVAFKKIQHSPSMSPEQWEIFDGTLIVRNVAQPELIPFFPPSHITNRHEAVLIAPGGAMMLLAIVNEGVDVARSLAAKGYTAFVLKYRVNSTPQASADFIRTCEEFIGSDPGSGSGNFTTPLDLRIATDDVSDAMQFLQTRAEQYAFNRSHIHYLGFSAGAALGYDFLSKGSDLTLKSMACIYGPMEKVKLKSDAAPPLFLALADDDPLFSRQGFEVINQWRALKQRVEFHLFEKGGHGFGMAKKSSTSDNWLEFYANWLAYQA
jgi:acetyl esterase/lipase